MIDKPKYDKKYVLFRFRERVPCPYNCGLTFPSNLSLARHVLKDHNWNADYSAIATYIFNTLVELENQEPYDPPAYEMAIKVCKEVREILETLTEAGRMTLPDHERDAPSLHLDYYSCDKCGRKMVEIQPWDFLVTICLNSEHEPRVREETWGFSPKYRDMAIEDLPENWKRKLTKHLLKRAKDLGQRQEEK